MTAATATVRFVLAAPSGHGGELWEVETHDDEARARDAAVALVSPTAMLGELDPPEYATIHVYRVTTERIATEVAHGAAFDLVANDAATAEIARVIVKPNAVVAGIRYLSATAVDMPLAWARAMVAAGTAEWPVTTRAEAPANPTEAAEYAAYLKDRDEYDETPLTLTAWRAWVANYDGPADAP